MTKKYALRKAARRREWADIAEAKAKVLQAEYDSDPRSNDWAFWSEPIKIGHHSERRHRRAREALNNKKQRIFDLLDRAKLHREKAEHLERFASTHKGDAERRRQSQREKNDTQIAVGSRVIDGVFNREAATVTKVNAKSYRIKFSDGVEMTRDKSFLSLVR